MSFLTPQQGCPGPEESYSEGRQTRKEGEHYQRPPHDSLSAGAKVRSSRVRMIAEKVKSVNSFRFSGQTAQPGECPRAKPGHQPAVRVGGITSTRSPSPLAPTSLCNTTIPLVCSSGRSLENAVPANGWHPGVPQN